ncbi:hypothetical protein D3C80_2012410 [compost metagenome]
MLPSALLTVGRESIIAKKPAASPAVFIRFSCSPNSKKAAITGINSDKRCATAVTTIPEKLIDFEIK